MWPLPGQNMLHNFHFADGLSSWSHPATAILTPKNSHTSRDTQYVQTSLGGLGVRYLRIDCTKSCPAAILTQDVKLSPSQLTFGLPVAFAATLRTEASAGDATLDLTELDANGTTLAHATVTRHIGATSGQFDGDQSVVLSSTFIYGQTPFAIYPQAKTLRWSLSLSPGPVYDLVDTWLIASGR